MVRLILAVTAFASLGWNPVATCGELQQYSLVSSQPEVRARASSALRAEEPTGLSTALSQYDEIEQLLATDIKSPERTKLGGKTIADRGR